MTAETDISPLLECAARLETIINTKHWYGVIIVPLSEMPCDLTLIEAGAIASQLSDTRSTCDITYNGVVGVFVIINKRFAQNLNRNCETVSVARTS